MTIGPLEVLTSERTAWRAVYIYLRRQRVLVFGLDPDASRAQVFFGTTGVTHRIALPILRWKYPCSSFRMSLYQLQGRILMGLDGRYGWGRR